MTSSGSAEKLYTPEILGLAVELAGFPLDASMRLSGEARSNSCGSTLQMSLSLNTDGHITAVGMQVVACAIGQASAAIFARHANESNTVYIETTLRELENWLASGGPLPTWPDIELIARARDFPGRHGAILLPWRAAEQALSKAQPSG